MITKMPISSERCHELLDFLDTMRLPEEPVNTEEIISLVEEKDAVEDLSSSSARKYSLDDPANYAPNVPFLLHDENGETIISRTANGINGRELNPYEVNWQEITLYDSDIVKDLLEKVDSMSLMDVAQAIDDEEKRHIRMDGQYTVISSNFYGTGQGSSIFFSYTRDNSSEDLENVPAVTIAEGILDQRKKADAYRKKIKENTDGQTQGKKRHIIEVIDEPESHLHVNLKESNIDQSVEDEINQLKKECDEWKAKHAKLERILQARTDELDKWHCLFEEETKRTVMVDSLEEELDRWKKRCEELESKKEPEIAFNAQTGKTCFTSTQMGILFQAVSELTEPLPPGKTTLGDLIESIAGYSATTVNQNMKGAHRPKDIETIVEVLKEKLPKLAEKVKKL